MGGRNSERSVSDPNSYEGKQKFAADQFIFRLEQLAKEEKHDALMAYLHQVYQDLMKEVENDIKRLKESSIKEFEKSVEQYQKSINDTQRENIQREMTAYLEKLRKLEKDFIDLNKFLLETIKYIDSQIDIISREYSKNAAILTSKILNAVDQMQIQPIHYNKGKDTFDLKSMALKYLQRACDQLNSKGYSPLNLVSDTSQIMQAAHDMIMSQMKIEDPLEAKHVSQRVNSVLHAIVEKSAEVVKSEKPRVDKMETLRQAKEQLSDIRDDLVDKQIRCEQMAKDCKQIPEESLATANIESVKNIVKDSEVEVESIKTDVDEILSECDDLFKSLDSEDSTPEIAPEHKNSHPN